MKQMFFLSLTFHIAVLSALLWLSRGGYLSKTVPPRTIYTVSLVSPSTLPGGSSGSRPLPSGPRQSTSSSASPEKLPPKGVGRVQEKVPVSRKTGHVEKPKSEVPDDVTSRMTKKGKPKTAGPEGYKRKGQIGPVSSQTSRQIASKGGAGGQRSGGAGEQGSGGAGEQGSGGAGTGGSGMRLDTAFDFPDYLAMIRDRIWENWAPPFEGSEVATRRATVFFKILRDGKVAEVYVESGSESLPFDRSAFKAVTDINMINPLPPLPQTFVGEYLGVHFVFEYEPELM